MISPAAFREFMLPYYRRLTGFFGDHDIRTMIVDTDGDCMRLIPLFLEAGLTGVYPFEVQAGMDVLEVRKRFPTLQILGGIDKRVLAEGVSWDEIDRELERKLSILLPLGGYVPYADHLIPPNVPWRNFEHYRRRVRELTEGSPINPASSSR